MKPFAAVAGTMLVIIVGWLLWDRFHPRTCEEMLEQSTPNLKASLAFLQVKGEVALGRSQTNDLSDGAERIGVQFRGCCMSHQMKAISDAEFGRCIQRAQAYDGTVKEVKRNVEQAQAASKERDPGRAQQYSSLAKEQAWFALNAIVANGAVPPPVQPGPPQPQPRPLQRPDAAIGGGPRGEFDAQPPDAAAHRHDAPGPGVRDAGNDASGH